MKVAFDIDQTLIWEDTGVMDTPRYRVIQLLDWFVVNGDEVFVWSGCGVEYAQHWVEKLGLHKCVKVVAKGSFKPDIAVDDEEVKLGIVNIKV